MQNKFVGIIGGVAGLVLVVVGVMKTINGIKELMGSTDPVAQQASELATKANSLVAEAMKRATEFSPKYQKMLEDIDSQGLTKYRTEHKAEAQAIHDAYQRSSEDLRAAGAAFAEASKLRTGEMAEYLNLLSQANGKYAETRDGVCQIVKLVLDESITDADMLIAKMEPITTATTAANAAADELAAKSTKLVAEHPEVFGEKK